MQLLNWTLLAALIVLTTTAQAQQITVKKVKGTQALISIEGGQITQGKTYSLREENSFAPDEQSESKSRLHFFDFSMQILNAKTVAANTEEISTKGSLGFAYGWNRTKWEYSLGVILKGEDNGLGVSSEVGFSGTADWNFVPNVSHLPFIPGLSLRTEVTSITPILGAEKSARTILLPSFFIKWFPEGSNVALRFDLGAYSHQLTGGSKAQTAGTLLSGGIQTYF